MKVMLKVFLILFIILSVFSLSSCGGDTDKENSASDTNDDQNIDLSQFDEDIQELLTRNDNYKEPVPTPFEKINKDIEDQKITKEESVILSYLAALQPEKLPDNYQAEIPDGMGDGVLIELENWLVDNWESLSDEHKEILEPFYLLPDNPKSFWNPLNEEKSESFLEKLEIIPGVYANPGLEVMETLISTNPKRSVKIGFKANDAAQKKRALWVNESLHKSWPMFKDLLTMEPTETVYIWITNTGPKFYGFAKKKYGDGADRCYIILTNKEDEKITKALTSHELFHCFQYEIPLKYDKTARKWMMEATATWAEHWVYPEYNTEWRFLPWSFELLDEDLIQWDRKKEYARYTWYLFLTQYSNNINKIKTDLFAVKNKDGRLVVKDTPNLGLLFSEYALWNWNQDPEYRYKDAPSFPTGKWKGYPMYPNGNPYKEKLINTKEELKQTAGVEALAMAYRAYAFTDDIDKVVFKFEKIGDDLHRRQALIKIGDIWHWEDWTEIKERKFCRTRDEEKVLAVVLIYSNADHDSNNFHYDKYKVDSREKCNPEWRGITKWSYSYSTGWDILYAKHTLSKQSYMISHDTLVYDEDEDEFYIKDQFITYYFSDDHIVNLNQDCGLLYERDLYQQKGSASNSWEINKDYPSKSKAPLRMRVSRDNAMEYKVTLDAFDYDKEWLTSTSVDAERRKACPLEGIFTPGPGTYSKSDTTFSKSSDIASEPNSINAKLSDNGNSIKGNQMQEMGGGGDYWNVNIEVDYRYG